MAKKTRSGSRSAASPRPDNGAHPSVSPPPPRQTATLSDLLPDLGTLGRAGLFALCAAVLLAPILGGMPTGPAYGHDPVLGLLRVLVLLAGLCLVPAPSHGPTTGAVRGARLALWTASGITLLSLLVHSRFLTSPVLLFAMIPATLDWLCYALAFTLALRLSPDRRALNLLVAALVIGGAWVAFQGAWQYRGYITEMGDRAMRVQATFVAPTFLSGFLALCLPVTAAAAFLRVRENLAVFVTALTAALMAGVLVATGSRLGVAAAGLGLVIALALALGGRIRLPWARIGGLVAAMLVLMTLLRGPLLSRAPGNTSAQEQSGASRTWIWKGTLAQATANPLLGTGPGTFEYRNPPYSPVAKTNHAHSSYLQVAAEQGWPALIAVVVALASALWCGLVGLLRRREEEDTEGSETRRLLLCGLYGGLIAGILRSIFDSEWTVFGNALPFWTVAGLVAGAPAPAASASVERTPHLRNLSAPRLAALGGRVVALVFAVMLLFNNTAREGAAALLREYPEGAARRAERAAGGWPPDPEALSLNAPFVEPERRLELRARAARIEPSGKRFFQLAREQERQGNDAEAIEAFQRSLAAEPTAMQTLRALATAQERAGDAAGALDSWRKLVALQEGTVGQVRAIPELPELHPMWAYMALGDDARKRGEAGAAAGFFDKAARIAEDYADTPPRYQRLEFAQTLQTGADLKARREEVRARYEKAMDALITLAAARGDATDRLRERRETNRARLTMLIEAAEAGRVVDTTQPEQRDGP